ncbi:2-oxoglutarate dehydrogenase complex dihydrolipoyllysine-residue succinyltransferase [Spectribacter hydrogenoxidans]|uniref:Dihydrolipoyllysine-residue succinyltransferase component of 2-oxoglutarate dehydrogenase complex n=1 Tax=Spectribacter hydrogenoxidans TaxID=3075608 RepID=A0ABU3C267_9GAMM|nr:2-oxoglutarate dehydrogenase complex dihydrolipoyllysine-residue succinyltransferase [Salinisphaera sp. W335]MDT0635649.1 2-oxoglutarate dehydrogenase complex dihydrolipoyllysine-residue succinyltransferase [Salinisphaera sp. W335]
MSMEIKVPELPESVSEATVGEWHVAAGDSVDRDQNVVDLETDKVMLEVPATAAGTIKEIRVEAGQTVHAGDVLAIVEEGEGGAAGGADDTSSDDASPTASDEDTDDGEDKDDGDHPIPSPAARKLMDEHGLAAGDVKGSGKDGRITKGDVLSAVEDKPEAPAPAKSKPQAEPAADTDKAPASADKADQAAIKAGAGERLEQRVPMTRIRARIAERLLEATQSTAMLTTFNEVDMQAVTDVRDRYKEKFEKDHDVRLGFMSFFVKAAVEALKRFPVVNASIDAEDIVYHGYYDVGIAVSSPRGLLVPILRDADQLSYAEIESSIRSLGKRAQESKITMDELSGGTFTITNGGVFGSMLSTPILNPPQSAILGMHAVNDRPMVVDGEIRVRPMMYLALSYDHRIIDGRDAVLFLRTIKELIEDPARLLLQI